MERTFKIFISCAFGAGIGTAVSLEVNHYFWWLGIMIGGFAGYIFYEFEEVLAAIRVIIGFRPDRRMMVKSICIINASVSVAVLFFSCAGMFAVSLQCSAEWSTRHQSQLLGVFIPMLLALIFMIGLVAIILGFQEVIRTSGENAFIYILITNPITIIPLASAVLVWSFLTGVWTGVKALVRYIPAAPLVTWRGANKIVLFAKAVFIMIHSEIRLLCGVDAAMGAIVGYLIGSVFSGAVVGGIIGVINYKLISVRILRLAPDKRI